MARIFRPLRNVARLLRLIGPVQFVRFAAAKAFGVPQVSLRIRALPSPLVCRTNYSDIRVLWQVFGARDLEIPLSPDSRLIIDAGANVGYTTAYFAHRVPQARIVAIEPDDENCRMIRANCAAYGNVDLIEGAIWPRESRLAISNPTSDSWAFQVDEAGQRDGDTIPGVTVDGIMSRSGRGAVDLLKIDIEGAEEKLFSEDAERWLGAIDVMAIEVHGRNAQAAIDRAVGSRFSRQVRGEKLILTRIQQSPAA